MQTSFLEIRVLYPSLNAAQSAAFFLPAVFYPALRQSVTRQYATFHPLAFVITIAATLEMQTSFLEIRVLYPSFNAAQSAAFFLPAVFTPAIICHILSVSIQAYESQQKQSHNAVNSRLNCYPLFWKRLIPANPLHYAFTNSNALSTDFHYWRRCTIFSLVSNWVYFYYPLWELHELLANEIGARCVWY